MTATRPLKRLSSTFSYARCTLITVTESRACPLMMVALIVKFVWKYSVIIKKERMYIFVVKERVCLMSFDVRNTCSLPESRTSNRATCAVLLQQRDVEYSCKRSFFCLWSCVYTHTHIYAHTRTHVYAHAHVHKHTHMHPCTHAYTRTHALSLFLSLSLSLSLSNTHTHLCAHAQSYTHTSM